MLSSGVGVCGVEVVVIMFRRLKQGFLPWYQGLRLKTLAEPRRVLGRYFQ